MVGRLITFPLRVGVRGAQLWFRAAEEVAARATSGAVRVAGAFTRNGSSGSERSSAVTERARPPATERQRSSGERARRRDPRSQATATRPPQPPTRERTPGLFEPSAEAPTPAPPAAAHVSAEPELVREEAAPGAEEGAGATVTVREPWDGYARMTAREVIARLADATSAELAAVALYESGNRSRQTVLEAVQRHMRAADGGGLRD